MHAYSVGLTIAATVALLAFVAVSAVDGIYIHLVRLKLHARPESWREHLLHTARAVLFLPMLLALFGVVSGGMLLRIGLGAVMIDQVVEVLDMMSCKAAVKAGDPLTQGEIEALLARRDLVERSSNCPHGRPTTLRLSLRDLEKQFKRTGF